MKPIVGLIQSRKFWLTLISTASAITMYRTHVIDGGQLATALQVAGAALVIAIAHEDNGTKSAPTPAVGELLVATGIPATPNSGDVSNLTSAQK